MGASQTETTDSISLHQTGSVYGNNSGGFFTRIYVGSTFAVELFSSQKWSTPTELDVVLTFDGLTMRLFVDGALDQASATRQTLLTLPTTFVHFRMGRLSEENYALKGSLHALTVWAGTALTATQISEMYAGTYANTPTPSHHLNFCQEESGGEDDTLNVLFHLRGDVQQRKAF